MNSIVSLVSLFVMVAALILAAVDYWLRRKRSKVGDEAGDILLRTLQSDPNGFLSLAGYCWLYLRPFPKKGLFPKDKVSYALIPNYKGVGRLQPSIEETLASALAISNQGILIGLGERHVEYLGGGRITIAEENWKDTALILSIACRGIVLLPTTSPGVLWEVEQILRIPALRIKTIVFMPPFAGLFCDRNRRAWTRTREVLSQVGMHLPKHRIKGALMRISRDGGTFGHVVPRFDSETELALQLAELRKLPEIDENCEGDDGWEAVRLAVLYFKNTLWAAFILLLLIFGLIALWDKLLR